MTSWAPSHIVAPHYILACMSHTQIPARLGPHAPPYERRIDEEVKRICSLKKVAMCRMTHQTPRVA